MSDKEEEIKIYKKEVKALKKSLEGSKCFAKIYW